MGTILVAIEDVIGKHDQLRGFHPIAASLPFIYSLKQSYKIVLSSMSLDLKSTEYWLMLNGITQNQLYEHLLYREGRWDDLDEVELRVAHLRNLQGAGHGVDMVISADPGVIANVVALGVQGLLWASPTYMRPEFQPGGARVPKAWDSIVEGVDRQKELAAADTRRNTPEE